MENLWKNMESLNIEVLRKQISDEVLTEILQFANKQQLEKIVTSAHSTQQMKTICTKILAERAIVTKSDNESAKGKTETSNL